MDDDLTKRLVVNCVNQPARIPSCRHGRSLCPWIAVLVAEFRDANELNLTSGTRNLVGHDTGSLRTATVWCERGSQSDEAGENPMP